MSTPIHEIPEPEYVPVQHYATNGTLDHVNTDQSRPLSRDGTYVDNGSRSTHQSPEAQKGQSANLHQHGLTDEQIEEMNSRIDDDLQMLKAERIASNHSGSIHHTLSRKERRNAGFASLTTIHSEKSKAGSGDSDHSDDDTLSVAKPVQKSGFPTPPDEPSSRAAKIFKRIHESTFLVRYFLYITPVAGVILIPLLLGAFLFKKASVGGVELMWFSIWLMIVWLSLWLARIISKTLTYPVGTICSLFTNSHKKWRDMARMLELPCTLFFWALAVFISFLPTMTNHHIDGNKSERDWESTANKVWISCLVAMAMNLLEKIIIQLIAISFHERTYEDRIMLNKFQVRTLTKLYEYTNEKKIEDELYARSNENSGTRTPLAYLRNAKEGLQTAVNKASDLLGKAAHDFTGKQVQGSSSPQQVVLQILSDRDMLASFGRRIFRAFAKDGQKEFPAQIMFDMFHEDERDGVLSMFDKDLNGDISGEEVQNALIEVARERKSIIASLKDLDSVVSKLDKVFTFLVLILTVLVFVAILSNSTTTILASTSSSLLAISWLFSQTAQEFLASIIFVFVKHPFDVGDRVDIFVNGEVVSYFVKEIALMYTEFKRMEGHVVQAPNSTLNQLFILNMRRSPALAEGVPITIKFGSTIEQIDELRKRMLDFVTTEKSDYQPKVFTEVRDIKYLHEVTLNVVFFYKSNWQNELVRLQRRNKFMCALMLTVAELGIESPHRRWPGQTSETPVYLQGPLQGVPSLFTTAPNNDNLRDQVLNERMQGGDGASAFASTPAGFGLGAPPAGPGLAGLASPSVGTGAGDVPPASPLDAPSSLSIPAATTPMMSPLSPSGTPGFWRKEQGSSRLHRSKSVAAHSKKFDLSLGTSDNTLQYGDAFLGEKKGISVDVSRPRSRGDSVGQCSLERVTSRTSQSTTDSRNIHGSMRRRDRLFSSASNRHQVKEEMSVTAPVADNTNDDLETGMRVPHSTPVDPVLPAVHRRTTTGGFRTAKPQDIGDIRPI